MFAFMNLVWIVTINLHFPSSRIQKLSGRTRGNLALRFRCRVQGLGLRVKGLAPLGDK